VTGRISARALPWQPAVHALPIVGIRCTELACSLYQRLPQTSGCPKLWKVYLYPTPNCDCGRQFGTRMPRPRRDCSAQTPSTLYQTADPNLCLGHRLGQTRWPRWIQADNSAQCAPYTASTGPAYSAWPHEHKLSPVLQMHICSRWTSSRKMRHRGTLCVRARVATGSYIIRSDMACSPRRLVLDQLISRRSLLLKSVWRLSHRPRLSWRLEAAVAARCSGTCIGANAQTRTPAHHASNCPRQSPGSMVMVGIGAAVRGH
jgi:hypothetical protein